MPAVPGPLHPPTGHQPQGGSRGHQLKHSSLTQSPTFWKLFKKEMSWSWGCLTPHQNSTKPRAHTPAWSFLVKHRKGLENPRIRKDCLRSLVRPEVSSDFLGTWGPGHLCPSGSPLTCCPGHHLRSPLSAAHSSAHFLQPDPRTVERV
jgi:hypothetical protein